ncbi:DUF2993 domain-containing protein [Microbacterium fluvii]|uniref:DUF2993 domain-containing protein n=1 Tax=Microbacterium fluvii TaxID=415215 RepID=A0ABW2HBT5_9MICO|nr:DUF2993 domain-containing protein [Microbacterium fluvii]MCU4671525.1 DUF2993 domain-containing protein [Microbacterium fluvii]
MSAPTRRRRVWPWLVGVAIVAVLAVVAWFVGEAIARDLVTRTIRETVVTELSLPADQQIDVGVEGSVLPQLIGGTLTEVHIASDDVTLDGLTGDVSVSLTDVPVRGGEIGAGSATIALDETQVRQLMSRVDGFPAESLGLAAPDVTFSTELSPFGLSIPVGVAVTPSADAGDIVLTPASLELGGAEISADDLRGRFGALADAVLRDWTVCIAEYLPAGATLTSVEVSGDALVAGFDLAGGIAVDPDLQQPGTCA